MSIFSLLLLAVSLSMDAFAVAVCKGLATQNPDKKQAFLTGAWFGTFQALMPTLGYLLGSAFERTIAAYDHWLAFFLLGSIGVNMIRESLSNESAEVDASFAFRPMLVMAIATSIDAMAVGITFSFLKVSLLRATALIGITTFILAAGGFRIGSLFGAHFKSIAERCGGIVLILIGFQILLEHLGVIS